ITGATSPVTVHGLLNGTSYFFKVTALNCHGEGAASSPAGPASPIGPPAELAFLQQPTNVEPGSPFPVTITVEIRDAAHQRVPTATNGVQLSFGNNANGMAGLFNSTFANAVRGVASFPGVGVNSPGTASGFTLLATSSGLANATSAPFNVFVPT